MPQAPSFCAALAGSLETSLASRERGFVALDPPDDAEILRVLEGFTRRLARVLDRRGLGPKPTPIKPTPCPLTNRSWRS